MSRQRGDDLEDDFVPDDLVAMSEDEEDIEHFPDGDDIGGLLSADEDGEEEREVVSAGPSASEKKRKRREKEKERKAKKRKLAETVQPTELASVAAQQPVYLADYLSSMQAKTFSKLSSVELADVQIPETSIVDTTAWSGSRNLDQLVDFITEVLPTLRTRLSQKPKSKGSPTLIFVAAAALRVADVTRVLRDKRLRGEKSGEIAKLFGKHFKVEEHVAYLRKTRVAAAVGTPGRLGKLLTDTAVLSASALTHIIVDLSYEDTKKRSILDIPETRDELFKTVLGAPRIFSALKDGKAQLVLL